MPKRQEGRVSKQKKTMNESKQSGGESSPRKISTLVPVIAAAALRRYCLFVKMKEKKQKDKKGAKYRENVQRKSS